MKRNRTKINQRQRELEIIVFLNENRLNLNGPGSYNCNFYDLRKVKEVDRCFKGGSLMLWRNVLVSSKTDLVLVPNIMNTEVYIIILHVQFLSYYASLGGKKINLKKRKKRDFLHFQSSKKVV